MYIWAFYTYQLSLSCLSGGWGDSQVRHLPNEKRGSLINEPSIYICGNNPGCFYQTFVAFKLHVLDVLIDTLYHFHPGLWHRSWVFITSLCSISLWHFSYRYLGLIPTVCGISIHVCGSYLECFYEPLWHLPVAFKSWVLHVLTDPS